MNQALISRIHAMIPIFPTELPLYITVGSLRQVQSAARGWDFVPPNHDYPCPGALTIGKQLDKFEWFYILTARDIEYKNDTFFQKIGRPTR